MKKYAPIVMAVILAAAGCAKYEVYERNLQYMNVQTYQAEKAAVSQQLEEARQALAKAEASGNSDRVAAARTAYVSAQSKAKAVEAEDRRRSRSW